MAATEPISLLEQVSGWFSAGFEQRETASFIPDPEQGESADAPALELAESADAPTLERPRYATEANRRFLTRSPFPRYAGAIPESIGSLTNLKWLSLGGNALTGA